MAFLCRVCSCLIEWMTSLPPLLSLCFSLGSAALSWFYLRAPVVQSSERTHLTPRTIRSSNTFLMCSIKNKLSLSSLSPSAGMWEIYPSQSVLSAKATGFHPNPMISLTLVLTSHKDNKIILSLGVWCQEDVTQGSPIYYCCHDTLILALIPKPSAICKNLMRMLFWYVGWFYNFPFFHLLQLFQSLCHYINLQPLKCNFSQHI